MHHHDIWLEDCPVCEVGRLRESAKPLGRVFNGKLFVMPYAMYYLCDVCGYDVYDDSAHDILNAMMLASLPAKDTKTQTRPVAALTEHDDDNVSPPSIPQTP